MAQVTQAQRVDQAVQAAADAVREDGKKLQLVTADDAIGYVEGYEPSNNERKLFRKSWNALQLEVDDNVPDDEVEVVAEDVAEEVESDDTEVIDPFAGDDSEVPATLKMDDRRKLAVDRAREILGDEADTAAAEEAILALRGEGHEFYAVMKGSASQASKFMADFRKTQPGNNGERKKKLGEAYKDELQKMRSHLSSVRKTTEKGEAVRMLEEVKSLADDILGKLGSDG